VSLAFPPEEIEQSIAQRFEKQAAAHADRLAIRAGAQALTYAELNAVTNRAARAILRAAPGAERVVLLFEQGIPAVVAMLAVLKAGKTYVPLDPTHPPARLGELLEDAGAGLIVADSRHRAGAERLGAAAALQVVDTDTLDADLSSDNPGLAVPADAIAYMLYTSGSTGRPKGVIQKHRNLLHFVRSYTNSLCIGPADRIGWLHSVTFSATNMNVYPALLNGASVYPYDVKNRGVDQLAKLLVRERITVCQCVPSVFRHFLAGLGPDDRFPDLRIWELGGEPVFPRDVELFRRHFPEGARLGNRLALTEASVAAQYIMDRDTSINGTAIPVGRPADGVEISLFDEEGREVGDGEVGEIVLRSPYLSPGYWNRPELTERAFRADPERPEQRRYHTGDLGRLRADGLLEYFARKDFRVKIRGYTVEVAEIEAALLGLPGVEQVVVAAREDRRGDQRLVAYLVSSSEPPPTPAELRARLSARLPDYMLPAAFVLLGRLPVTSTGKVDRRALPAPEDDGSAPAEGYVAPRTPVEATVAGIWAEVFGVERIGIHDDFLALGGHSLLAGQIVARIYRSFGRELSPGVLFEAGTVAALGQQLGAAESDPGAKGNADASALPA
jgi:amino acid adenylation domain-containing protein